MSADPLLATVTDRCREEDRARLAKLTAVLDWAADVSARCEVVDHTAGGQLCRCTAFAGTGTPWVDEFAAMDLALAMKVSTDSGFAYLTRALELRYRLPMLWGRVARLEVPIWKAFKVTDQTLVLSATGAAWVDRALAPVLHHCSFAQIDRTLTAALAQFDPAEAERRRAAAAEMRHATVHLGDNPTESVEGVVHVTATLDLADALDLDAALRDGAAQLADLGSTDSLDVRRSIALGEMARTQLALNLDTGELTSGPGRGVTIYAHLDSLEADAVATVDNTQTPILVAQLLDWCRAAGTKITIKPVIDLAADLTSNGYESSDRLREQVMLRDRHCVFPHCTRRRVDLDHTIPFDTGGPTTSHNLAALCRRHHRAKTHSGWTYTSPSPGIHDWTSPTGIQHHVDRRPAHPARQP